MVCLHLSPGRLMFQYCIEDGQQFPHAGGERHLLGLPGSLQPLIEGPDHRLEAVGSYDGSRARRLRVLPLTLIQIQNELQKKMESQNK